MNSTEKKKVATEKIVRGGVKFCVCAFFGATAAYITRDASVPKIGKGMVLVGSLITGSMVGDYASDGICDGISSFAERWTRIRQEKKEEEALNG